MLYNRFIFPIVMLIVGVSVVVFCRYEKLMVDNVSQQESIDTRQQELDRQECARHYLSSNLSRGLKHQKLYDSKFYDSLGYSTNKVDSINAQRKFINSEIDYVRSVSGKMTGVDTIVLIDTNLSKVVYSYLLCHKPFELRGSRPIDYYQKYFLMYCKVALYYDLPKEDAIIVSKLWSRSVDDHVVIFDNRYIIIYGRKFDYVIVKSLKQK